MKNCAICSVELGKYKCPTCLIYYCSVVCCKKHREANCEVVEKPKVAEPEKPKFVTEDTVPLDKLQLLGKDKNVKDILANPHLRELLSTIDSSADPETIMSKAMLEPIFVEFADACMKVVEPSEN